MKTYGKKKLWGGGAAIQTLLNYCRDNIFVDSRAAVFPMGACLVVAIGVADL